MWFTKKCSQKFLEIEKNMKNRHWLINQENGEKSLNKWKTWLKKQMENN